MIQTNGHIHRIQIFLGVFLLILFLSVSCVSAQNPFEQNQAVSTVAAVMDDSVFDRLAHEILGLFMGSDVVAGSVRNPGSASAAQVNAVYCDDQNGIGLAVTSPFLNEVLFDGMRLELQATPASGGGLLVLKKKF